MVRRGDFSFYYAAGKRRYEISGRGNRKSFAFHFLNGLDADRRRFFLRRGISREGAVVRVRLCGSFCAMGRIKKRHAAHAEPLYDPGRSAESCRCKRRNRCLK